MSTRREFLLAGLPLFDWFRARDRRRWAGIEFRVLRNGSSRRRYLLIHGDEETARQVLTQHMTRAQGVAHLTAAAQRNVRLLGGLIDPNRMFSRQGAEASLRRLNPGWREAEIRAALHQLDRARKSMLRALLPPKGGLIIALHNNSPRYSVNDEVPISDQSSLPLPAEPHEFFLATDPADYAILARGPYNAVLQARPKGPDDGSLSRLAAQRGVRYVNLEVGLGKLPKQREMLTWLEQQLPA